MQELVGALGATVADVQMANLAYSLVAGSCMIAGGMIGVVVGWGKTLRIGLALAILGEAVVVTATSMDVFTWGGRFLVGLGASFITPSVLGLIPALYEGHARATAFGFVAAASAVSALVPIPFGILLDAAGFRVTFGVIALYFLGVLISTRFLPKLPKPDAGMSIDGVGIGLAAGGLALLLLGIARVSTWGVFEPLPGCPFTVFGIAPTLLCAMLVPKLLKTVRPRLVIRIGYGLVIAGVCSMALSLEPHGVTPLLFVSTSLVGAGLGIANSQANNAVASVVDPVAAQQSGGIQGTARNIGMALGTAVMGSLLLVAVGIGAAMQLDALEGVAPESLAAIEGTGVSFADDAAYEALANGAGSQGDEAAAVVETLASARCDAARASMFVLAGIVALAFVGTRSIVKRL